MRKRHFAEELIQLIIDGGQLFQELIAAGDKIDSVLSALRKHPS